MPEIYQNFLEGVVDNSPLASGGTTLTSTGLTALATVASPDVMWITINPSGVGLPPEIVQVTTHTAAAGSATIARAQQGTTAQTWAAGTVWRTGLTKSDTDRWPHRILTAKGDLLVPTAANTPSRLAVGANGLVLVADSAQATGLKWGYGVPAVCQARTSGTFNVPNNDTTLQIALNTEVQGYDPLSWHDNATNNHRVTPNIQGLYRVVGASGWPSDTDYTRVYLEVWKNGAQIGTNHRNDLQISGGTQGVRSVQVISPLIELNGTTDYVSLSPFQTNTSANAQAITATIYVELVVPGGALT